MAVHHCPEFLWGFVIEISIEKGNNRTPTGFPYHTALVKRKCKLMQLRTCNTWRNSLKLIRIYHIKMINDKTGGGTLCTNFLMITTHTLIKPNNGDTFHTLFINLCT